MVPAIKKPELENVTKQDNEKILIVIPEFSYKIEKKDEEKKIQKESPLFKKQKNKFSIDKVKSNLDAKIYTNRFALR